MLPGPGEAVVESADLLRCVRSLGRRDDAVVKSESCLRVVMRPGRGEDVVVKSESLLDVVMRPGRGKAVVESLDWLGGGWVSSIWTVILEFNPPRSPNPQIDNFQELSCLIEDRPAPLEEPRLPDDSSSKRRVNVGDPVV